MKIQLFNTISTTVLMRNTSSKKLQFIYKNAPKGKERKGGKWPPAISKYNLCHIIYVYLTNDSADYRKI